MPTYVKNKTIPQAPFDQRKQTTMCSGGGSFLLVAEDTGMQMRVIGQGVANSLTGTFDCTDSPLYMPSGGKFELYYTDNFSSSVSKITLAVSHWAPSYDAYVVDP